MEPCESSDVLIPYIVSFQRYYNLVAKPYISNKINYVLVFPIFKRINNTIINLQANATSCQISYWLNSFKATEIPRRNAASYQEHVTSRS